MKKGERYLLRVIKAMSNEVRFEIINQLSKGVKTRKELIESLNYLNVDYQRVFHHLRRLKEAELIEERTLVINGKNEVYVYLIKKPRVSIEKREKPLLDVDIPKSKEEMLSLIRRMGRQVEEGILPKRIVRENLKKIKRIALKMFSEERKSAEIIAQ